MSQEVFLHRWGWNSRLKINIYGVDVRRFTLVTLSRLEILGVGFDKDEPLRK
jgi:hypothetical protein